MIEIEIPRVSSISPQAKKQSRQGFDWKHDLVVAEDIERRFCSNGKFDDGTKID